jgi:alanine racemase
VITRRTFLAAPAALRPIRNPFGIDSESTPNRFGVDSEPVRGRFGVDSEPEPGVGGQFDPWVEVNAKHLRHNVDEIARMARGRPILAVIKNNGYGLGVANVARLLDDDRRIAGFAVVKLHEAMSLRDAGIRKPILLMGPFSDAELLDLAARDVMVMVYRDHGKALDAAAAKTGRPVAVHVKVDTGMGRVGIPHGKAGDLLRALAAQKSVRLEGVMTTLTEDEVFDREQVARFTNLTDDLARNGVRLRRHAASSYALFLTPEALLDMVRPGMAVFGVYSEPRFRRLDRLNLQPAVALRCRVALVKQLQPGESAGYNRAFMPAQATWVATLPAGHADGWPRAAAKGARVRIGDRLYPVVASVSASHTIVDLGPATHVAPGDVATLFDWTDGSRPEDVAEACGASVYDLTMHLNALLPRRIVS